MDDKMVHVGAYISLPLEKKIRISAATFRISKSEFLRIGIKYILNLSEDDLRLIYESDMQTKEQDDHSTSSREKT